MRKPETYDAGFAHQIGRYSDAIRVPAGQGHDQIIVSGTPASTRTAPSRPISRPSGVVEHRDLLAKAGASVSDIVSGRQYLTEPPN